MAPKPNTKSKHWKPYMEYLAIGSPPKGIEPFVVEEEAVEEPTVDTSASLFVEEDTGPKTRNVVEVVFGEIYCRWDEGDDLLCGSCFGDRGALVNHLKKAHNVFVKSSATGNPSTEKIEAAKIWFRDVMKTRAEHVAKPSPPGRSERPSVKREDSEGSEA